MTLHNEMHLDSSKFVQFYGVLYEKAVKLSSVFAITPWPSGRFHVRRWERGMGKGVLAGGTGEQAEGGAVR